MLDLKSDREPVTPKDAATLVLVRDAAAGLEVFCVERNKKSRFMGGAIVFPGGKLDGSDLLAEWTPLTTPPRLPARSTIPFTSSDAHYRSLAIAGARETLEEAAILHVHDGIVTQDELFLLRRELESVPDALRTFLAQRHLRLDLAALHPFARWITPDAESRRFDARFFLAVAPTGQIGAHDERETMASFWASPAEVLRRFEAGEVQLMPPTHRTIALLGACDSTRAAIAMADASNLDPICPRLVKQTAGEAETMALVLPGDPEHEVREARVPGESRYVLRGDRWLSENPPALTARTTARARSSVYSAQALADFCEVDLKTVHHWADRGKVPHFRTDGRHLRFHRNDVVRFLRAHGYPLPDVLVRARPTVALAMAPAVLESASLSLEELGKRLGSRFSVRRHANGAQAVAHLVAEAPDAVVLAEEDATLGFPALLTALREDAATAWILFAVLLRDPDDGARAAGADIVLAARDVVKLPGELARALAIV